MRRGAARRRASRSRSATTPTPSGPATSSSSRGSSRSTGGAARRRRRRRRAGTPGLREHRRRTRGRRRGAGRRRQGDGVPHGHRRAAADQPGAPGVLRRGPPASTLVEVSGSPFRAHGSRSRRSPCCHATHGPTRLCKPGRLRQRHFGAFCMPGAFFSRTLVKRHCAAKIVLLRSQPRELLAAQNNLRRLLPRLSHSVSSCSRSSTSRSSRAAAADRRQLAHDHVRLGVRRSRRPSCASLLDGAHVRRAPLHRRERLRADLRADAGRQHGPRRRSTCSAATSRTRSSRR